MVLPPDVVVMTGVVGLRVLVRTSRNGRVEVFGGFAGHPEYSFADDVAGDFGVPPPMQGPWRPR